MPFIKLSRSFQEDPLWTKRRVFSEFEAWLDLYASARYKKEPGKVMIGMNEYTCNYGQTLRSMQTWADRWNWTRSKVRRFLAHLQACHKIDHVSEQKTTRITILGYGGSDTKRPLNDQHIDHQTTTKEERKKEERMDYKNNPTVVDDPAEWWNKVATEFGLPKVVKLSDDRRHRWNIRASEGMVDKLSDLVEKIRESDFLSGRSDSHWRPSFDWLVMNEKNWLKVLEGNYDNRNGSASTAKKLRDKPWLAMDA